MLTRSSNPIAATTTLPRNGSRHPHDSIWLAGMLACSSATADEPASKPATVPTFAELLTRPRRFGAAHSAVYAMAPVYSPPTEIPCTHRNATNAMGAHSPTCA